MKEPDWERLREIGDEVSRLQDSRAFDRSAFERLMVEAKAAANGHEEFTEFVLNAADPAWLE